MAESQIMIQHTYYSILTIHVSRLTMTEPRTQSFIALHSSTVIAMGKGGSGGVPLEKILELHSLQRSKMHFCKIGDLLKSQ